MITLDVETGGEVAQNLLRLYDFMYYRLVDANVRKDVLLVVAVREMFQELRKHLGGSHRKTDKRKSFW
jgi:flagellar protein FliS